MRAKPSSRRMLTLPSRPIRTQSIRDQIVADSDTWRSSYYRWRSLLKRIHTTLQTIYIGVPQCIEETMKLWEALRISGMVLLELI